ncbi:CLUMA_CG014530, isoform A [Clunio marinus]|uniref:CLUMA_CG014530, isoform A n=1 Tax=Clunio marinus TaxID=568069 RepID=A0A1J1IL85_9DIPT|nr:CLUMA_CG014530, isoform A [Clunio marinus]
MLKKFSLVTNDGMNCDAGFKYIRTKVTDSELKKIMNDSFDKFCVEAPKYAPIRQQLTNIAKSVYCFI